MIEGQGGEPIPPKGAGLPGVVASAWLALRPGQVHGGEGVHARVPIGIPIGVKLLDEADIEARLLLGLADGRLLQRFARVHEPAGEGPSLGWVPPLDQDDLFVW